MTDDTDTIRVLDYLPAGSPAADAGNTPPQPADSMPRNRLLVVATALFTTLALAFVVFMADQKISHAQVCLIASVVLVFGGGIALSLHFSRMWRQSVEKRIAAAAAAVTLATAEARRETNEQMDSHARQIRAQFNGLSRDTVAIGEAVSDNQQELKTLIEDFIKRCPPPDARQRADLDHLTDVVRSVGKIVVGLACQRDPVEQEAEWFTEAVALGRQLETEDRRRRHGDGGATV